MMQSDIVNISAYAVFWLLFGILHSSMASKSFKEPWCRFLGPLAGFERLIFNAVSIVAIEAVLAFGSYNLANSPIFQPLGIIKWLFILVQLAGVGVILWSFRAYDIWRFAGIKQVWAKYKKRRVGDEPMALSTPHHFVRHPMYSGALLLLWFRPMDEAVLITNLFASIYLLIGLRLEEGRLLVLYGSEYAEYRQTVPVLIPNPKRRWLPNQESP